MATRAGKSYFRLFLPTLAHCIICISYRTCYTAAHRRQPLLCCLRLRVGLCYVRWLRTWCMRSLEWRVVKETGDWWW